MKFLFDLFPVLLFFIAFKFYGSWVPAEESLCMAGMCIPGGAEGAIYAATLIAILATFVQVGFVWLKHRRVETMHIVTLALIAVLGGATVAFQDETFIKWKPTVVNWLFAAVFLGSQYFMGKKPLVRRMMENAVSLSEEAVWTRLNLLWVLFFVAMGVLNLYVAFNFPTETWVNFKLFGLMGLTFLFVIVQAVYLARYIVQDEEDAEGSS